MKTCEKCGTEPSIDKERFCKTCKKIVLEKAVSDGKIMLMPPKQPSEMKGRKARSTQVLGGQPY